ncbi:hypothetical protein EDD22DRAFT_906930, partial [Suillus occidentalis]
MGGKALDVDRELSDNQQITHLPSVQSLSATLGEKKSSASHLSTRDLLRRDYKEDLSVLGIFTTFRNQKGKGRQEQFWMVKAEKGIAKKVWQGFESSEDAEEVTSDEARFGGSYVVRAYKQ